MKTFTVIFYISILLALSFTSNSLMAQKPYWLEEGGMPQSEFFTYYVGFGENASLLDAKQQAVQMVLQKISDQQGLNFSITGTSELKGTESEQNGTFNTDIAFSFNSKVTKDGKEISLPSLQQASDYYTLEDEAGKSNYKCWVLMRVPKNETYANKPIYEPWGAAPVWRSALYPGLGQMYKGRYSKKEKRKGTFFLLAETAMLAGIVASQVMYNYNHDQAYATQSQTQRDQYLSQRDIWGSARYGFAAGAGVVYLYSLIDAAANKKAKKYAAIKNRIDLQPTIHNEFYALSLKINLNN